MSRYFIGQLQYIFRNLINKFCCCCCWCEVTWRIDVWTQCSSHIMYDHLGRFSYSFSRLSGRFMGGLSDHSALQRKKSFSIFPTKTNEKWVYTTSNDLKNSDFTLNQSTATRPVLTGAGTRSGFRLNIVGSDRVQLEIWKTSGLFFLIQFSAPYVLLQDWTKNQYVPKLSI
jgi:hypothetical protein